MWSESILRGAVKQTPAQKQLEYKGKISESTVGKFLEINFCRNKIKWHLLFS